MKTFVLSLVLVGGLATAARAGSTVDPLNACPYGANIGWLNAYAGGTYGAVIGQYVCSGYVYSANAGWINLGSGSPANRIQYSNASANDYGVNMDDSGHLRGYAYGANIGWVNFEETGAPAVNLLTGQLTGYVWSANCGWISLGGSGVDVQTDSIRPGALDGNGLPIAWELQNFGTTGLNPNSDPNGTGMTLMEDYLAGTDPNDPSSSLRITSIGRGTDGTVTLTWTSEPTRAYVVQFSDALNLNNWEDFLMMPGLGANSAEFTDNNPNNFYRIRVYRPLYP